jgi:hypothetical protein
LSLVLSLVTLTLVSFPLVGFTSINLLLSIAANDFTYFAFAFTFIFTFYFYFLPGLSPFTRTLALCLKY